MLCQFTVKNYKSIRDEVTFDMQAAAISEHEDRIIRDKDGEIFLPVFARLSVFISFNISVMANITIIEIYTITALSIIFVTIFGSSNFRF